MSVRWFTYPLLAAVVGVFATVLLVAFSAAVIWPTLPSLQTLTDYRPKVPLRIYSADGLLIGEFGEERRSVVSMRQVPKTLVDAILAAEDERYYQHKGVDYVGVARAALANFTQISARQGASTITMQVARNFFLTREKTLTRKINEILLAFKIEASLSKEQILELYINQIYLGQRAYGFASASRIYFGKPLDKLSLAECAMLAGLPKAPSSFNPVANPSRAKLRQQYVLRRMREMNVITRAQSEEADTEPLTVKNGLNEFATKADYVAEMVRQAMYERYREDAYAIGLKVHTTISVIHQNAANAALRDGMLTYDRRHGYRGPEAYVELGGNTNDDALEEALQEYVDSEDIYPAIVIDATPRRIQAYRRGGQRLEITDAGLRFATAYLGQKVNANQRIRRGSIIRVQQANNKRWNVAQLPAAEAALVSADPRDGAIRALAGGFDFAQSQYNHVTQALRQPGSSFKPFIYSAALEKGFTPASIINDEPIIFSASQTGGEPWEPKNYDGAYDGPITMRQALARSKNLVSIRLIQAIGTRYAQDYATTRFGFDPKLNPPYLTLSLGAGNATPLQMLGGYMVFANGGYRVRPYFIQRIEDGRGNILFEHPGIRAKANAEHAIDERNAYIMTSMMRDVVQYGTASAARSLGRSDLAGKTGTTNDFLDAWFCGYNASLVAVVWTGYDKPHSLGRNETGSSVALPIWMRYMGKVLKGVPETPLDLPSGVITSGGEVYLQEFGPRGDETEGNGDAPPGSPSAPESARNQLF